MDKQEPPHPHSSSAIEAIVGLWRLVSADNWDSATKSWTPYVFGNPPSGYFIFDPTGHASVQIMTTPPVSIASPDNPTPVEALKIFNNYIGYYGTYTLDAGNIHVLVEGAWDPSQVGTDQVRPYELRGDTMIIGDQVTYRRTLQRVVGATHPLSRPRSDDDEPGLVR